MSETIEINKTPNEQINRIDYDADIIHSHKIYRYLKTAVVSPFNVEIKQIANLEVFDTYQECKITYNLGYINGSTTNKDFIGAKSLDFSILDNGVEGYILEKIYTNKKMNQIGTTFLLNFTRGDFIKIEDDILSYSTLVDSISCIGKSSRAGLIDDFISYVIGYERIEKPKTENLDIKNIFDICCTWFNKSTSELQEVVDTGATRIKETQKTSKPSNPLFQFIKEEKIMVDLEKLDPSFFLVPSKAFADMFNFDYNEIQLTYKKDDEIFRMWVSHVDNDELSVSETGLFLAIGNMLYVFNQDEQLVWINHLDQDVEGYETIPANALYTKLYDILYNIIGESEKFKNVEISSTESELRTWFTTSKDIYKEIALLLVACTNTEIANENLSLPELVIATSEILGYKFEHIQLH